MDENQTPNQTNQARIPEPLRETGAIYIDVNEMEPHPRQPRKYFDEKAMQELAESIRANGILNPLIVTLDGNKIYIVSGERRWRAAKMLGLKEVPVLNLRHVRLHTSHGYNMQEPLQVFELMWLPFEYCRAGFTDMAGQPVSPEEAVLILRFLHNPKNPKLKRSLIPDWALVKIAELDPMVASVCKDFQISLSKLAAFATAWASLHPLVQEALEEGRTYWGAARHLSPWIKKLRRAHPNHPDLGDEALRNFIGEYGRRPLPELLSLMQMERDRLLQQRRLPIPPRKRAMTNQVKRWWRFTGKVVDAGLQKELVEKLKRIEALQEEIEKGFEAAGLHPWQ